MKDLEGKRVLVTGAADGIGRGAALAFAREGAFLALADIEGDKAASVADEIRRLGGECESYQVDVADPQSVDALAAAVEERFGGVDVLVNVAGVCVVSEVVDMTLGDWEWILGVNLSGPFLLIRRFVPAMRERGSGHVVNVASVGGLYHFGLIGAYCATKAGLVALSEALDQEVFAEGVRVTAFCPGLISTGIVERMRFRGYSDEKFRGAADFIRKHVMSAERAGELIVDSVRNEKPMVVITLLGKALVQLNRFAPWLARFVMRRGKRLPDRAYGLKG
jgi:NAD(P)-dependent dehydrogenase (short-subunit alcohol dehydrogenase family)